MTALTPIPLTDNQLLAMVNRIAAEPGRSEKERLLADLAATTDGRMLIQLCYNPFKTWGVTQKAMPTRTGPDIEAASMLVIEGLLNRLAKRELSGNAAREAVDAAFGVLPPAAGELLWRCLNKDLKAGVAEASIKAVDPALVPTFAVMRAHLYEEKRITAFPVGCEPKMDGYRITFIARNGSGGFFTRTGKVVPDLDHMVEPTLKALKHWVTLTRLPASNDPVDAMLAITSYENGVPSIVLDGEMMPDSGAFADVKRAMKEERVIFNIFDMLTWEEFDKVGPVEVPYIERRMRVMSFVTQTRHLGDKLAIMPVKVARSHEEIQAIYQKHRAAGHEGTMVKKLDGFYHKKKCHEWQKIKNEDTEDLPIVGVFNGESGGKYESTIGGVIVQRMHEGKPVHVRVSGIDDATRAEIWKLWEETCAEIGLDPMVGYKPGHTFELSGIIGPLIGRIVEVEFHEIIGDSGSLRHPRFVQFRDDKTGEIDK